MRNTIAMLLFCAFFMIPCSGYNQGWQWARTSTNWSATAGVEVAGPTVMDHNRNIFVAMTSEVDSIGFAGHTIYNTGLYSQIVIVKYDSAGSFLWAVATQNNNAWLLQVAIDNENNLFVYGYKGGSITMSGFPITGSQTGFLVKISPAGTVIWDQDIDLSSSTGFIYGGLTTDAIGNAYVSGPFESAAIAFGSTILTNVDSTATSNDIYVVKYDASGAPVWAKSIKGAENDEANEMTVGKNNDLYITGRAQSDTLTFDSFTLYGSAPDSASYYKNRIAYLAKYDSDGNVLWAENIDRHIFVNGLATDPNDNVYVTGGFDTTVVIGTDTFSMGHIAPPGFTNYGILISRFNANGGIAWAKNAGTDGYGQGWALTTDLCGHVWTCGSINTNDTVNFDGHTFVTGDQTVNPDPLFIVEYDTAGNYQHGMTLPTGGDDICGIVADKFGNFYIGGDYLTSTPTMIFGQDTIYNSPAIATENFYLLMYSYDSVLCATELATTSAPPVSQGVILFPNPAGGSITLRSDVEFVAGTNVHIYDITGRLLSSFPVSGFEATFSVNKLVTGVYLCVVQPPAGEAVVKQFVNNN